jgi:hypothetical protein
MERVTFDKVLTTSQSAALAEFMKLHPELIRLHAAGNFRGISDNSKIPYGTIAHFAPSTQLPASFLPANMSHITALFHIHSNFSELNFLRRSDLDKQTLEFHAKLGEGPLISDVAFKNDVLPRSLGKDLHKWSPFLGKGFVSIIHDPQSTEDHERYMLSVSVPELPVVASLYKATFADREIPTAEFLTTHPVVGIAKELTLRNACKVAHEFSTMMGIELTHRRPNIFDKSDVSLPFPVAASMNPGPVLEDQCVKVASGLVSSRNNPSACRQGVYTAGPSHAVVISHECSTTLLPFSAPKLGTKVVVGTDIGRTFVNERVFWGEKEKSSGALHPRISKAKGSKEMEDFIVKSLKQKVSVSKPKMLFLHK